MRFSIDTNDLRTILEETKDQLLIDIPEGENLLISISERGANHGVYQFFYKLRIKIAEYEKEQILKEMSK